MSNRNEYLESLRRKIREERERKRKRSLESLVERILRGDTVSASGHLLFHTEPQELDTSLHRLLELLGGECGGGSEDARRNILLFLTRLAVDLASFLPEWVLKEKLDDADIDRAAAAVRKTLSELAGASPEAAQAALEATIAGTASRLKAEGLDAGEAAGEAEKLAAGSLSAYVDNMAAEIASSNLLAAARARKRGECATEIGNDYAVFLPYVIWVGGSFVTTNPVLIKVAWETDPGMWNSRIDGLILSQYRRDQLKGLLDRSESEIQEAITSINSLVTMSVVEENCRLLRDIYLATGGREGYVSLQVNPKNHADTDRMVSEVKNLYAGLEKQLEGVPNVVFKLPATSAGLQAAEMLTQAGIGVTITVSFSVFQALAFGRVLSRGRAPMTYIALMNGRMAFPARDELKEKGTPGGVEAARWAGVEVARKSYRRLYGEKKDGGEAIDPRRVKLLIASLRIYDDWIPDISAQWGCPVITFFPDVRRTYDSHERPLDPESIAEDTPADAVKTLGESEIFRQAWWTPEDGETLKPERVLTVGEKDADALFAWPPVSNTLKQFVELYDQMGGMVKARMKQLAGEED